jgi:hypothetical protein
MATRRRRDQPQLALLLVRVIPADTRIPGVVGVERAKAPALVRVVGVGVASVVGRGGALALVGAGGGAGVAVAEQADAVAEPADDAAWRGGGAAVAGGGGGGGVEEGDVGF